MRPCGPHRACARRSIGGLTRARDVVASLSRSREGRQPPAQFSGSNRRLARCVSSSCPTQLDGGCGQSATTRSPSSRERSRMDASLHSSSSTLANSGSTEGGLCSASPIFFVCHPAFDSDGLRLPVTRVRFPHRVHEVVSDAQPPHHHSQRPRSANARASLAASHARS